MENTIKLAYSRYLTAANSALEPDLVLTHVDDPAKHVTRVMTMEEFIQSSKTDDDFIRRWIEPIIRELVTLFDSHVSFNEFEGGSVSFVQAYPQTFDFMLDLLAKLTLHDETSPALKEGACGQERSSSC